MSASGQAVLSSPADRQDRIRKEERKRAKDTRHNLGGDEGGGGGRENIVFFLLSPKPGDRE